MPGVGYGRHAAGANICRGCAVAGFAEHDCRGEIVEVLAVGQAVIHACDCGVDRGCRGYKAPIFTPITQTSPYGYARTTS